MDIGNLKSGGDALNMGEAGSLSGGVDASGVGAGIGALAGIGAGLGGAAGFSGNAVTEQGQNAGGGDVGDNTSMGDVNINT